MQINYGKVCGTCKNCGLRRQDVPSELIQYIYGIFCMVDDTSLGSTNCKRAEYCREYIERKDVRY